MYIRRCKEVGYQVSTVMPSVMKTTEGKGIVVLGRGVVESTVVATVMVTVVVMVMVVMVMVMVVLVVVVVKAMPVLIEGVVGW